MQLTLNIIILTFILGLVLAGVIQLYIKPPKEGLRWVIWLGGMILGADLFRILIMLQYPDTSFIVLVIGPFLSTLAVVVLNLLAQLRKHDKHELEAEIEKNFISRGRSKIGTN